MYHNCTRPALRARPMIRLMDTCPLFLYTCSGESMRGIPSQSDPGNGPLEEQAAQALPGPFALPRYGFPPGILPAILLSALLGIRRSFAADSRWLVRGISKLAIIGEVPALFPLPALEGEDPPARGWLITMNHFHRPGFGVWWIPIAIASRLPVNMSWVMTGAWTYPDPFRSRTLTPLSQWLFGRIARVYGFVNMPPMPPRPGEEAQRAQAVRRVLTWVRATARPVLGFAPEGMDPPPGQMIMPPSGVGRFINHLANSGLTILPVAGFEQGDSLCLRFGEPYRLPARFPGRRHDLDVQVGECVMHAIADCLPDSLRSPILPRP